MSRNEEVRQAVLELDGWCCQVCGHDGRESSTRGELHVHHVQPLGMGGSEERDTAGNCITLCGHHHGLVHDGKLAIKEFDRGGKALTVLLDGKAIDTWFFHRGEEEELAQALDDISALHKIDGAVAERAWKLWKNAAYTHLDPTARSFAEFCESWGLDSQRMARLARLFQCALDLGLAWPPKMSATDFRRQLRDAGKIEPREYWYLIFNFSFIGHAGGSTCLPVLAVVRTNDEEALYESLQPHEVAVKVGKWIGIKVDQGRLSGPNGEEIVLRP